MKMSDFLVPPWMRLLGYALTITAVVGPYVVLYLYIPKYNAAKTELAELHKKIDALVRKGEVLETLRSACTDATERMKQERDKADQRRRKAEQSAQAKAPAHDTTIAELKFKLKEPTDARQDCKQLKDLIDDYTLGPIDRVRNNGASDTQGGGGTGTGTVRQ